MNDKIKHIHHIGHVVTNIEIALKLYRKTGFVCPPPALSDDGRKRRRGT
ncbi:hypothetical protein ACIQ69_22745 [Bacillus paramycoides]